MFLKKKMHKIYLSRIKKIHQFQITISKKQQIKIHERVQQLFVQN